MSIFDDKPLPMNIPTPTMGGKVFWHELDSKNGYTLQQHKMTGHYRILDENCVRVAWGEQEGAMRAKFYSLSEQDVKPKRGDVIGVHRLGVLYDHYGIYESDDCVYEYAAPQGDFALKQIRIQTTTLEKFIGDSQNGFILSFPEKYGQPGKVSFLTTSKIANTMPKITPGYHPPIFTMLSLLKEFSKMKSYKLYSPDDTIERAKMRLGESSYNLIFNNCEHYAIWCKTGVKESHQINRLLKGFQMR